jgi:hypothetical protein
MVAGHPGMKLTRGAGRIRFNLCTLVLLLGRYKSGRQPTWNRRRGS